MQYAMTCGLADRCINLIGIRAENRSMGILRRIASLLLSRVLDRRLGVMSAKFDQRHVHAHVADAVSDAIRSIPDVPMKQHQQLVEITVRLTKRGRDLASMTEAIERLKLPGIDRRRAAEIARFLSNRANAQIEQRRLVKLGCEQAKWLHSGAACFAQQADMEIEAAAHAAASGKKFWVTEGLSINGKHTWPGWDDGCRCVATAVIKGF